MAALITQLKRTRKRALSNALHTRPAVLRSFLGPSSVPLLPRTDIWQRRPRINQVVTLNHPLGGIDSYHPHSPIRKADQVPAGLNGAAAPYERNSKEIQG